MTQTQRSALWILGAVTVSALLIWVLIPARLLDSPDRSTENMPEQSMPADSDVSIDAPPADALLPGPNVNELESLQEQASLGDPEALTELCKYVTGADLYDLGDFEISDELRATCGEKR